MIVPGVISVWIFLFDMSSIFSAFIICIRFPPYSNHNPGHGARALILRIISFGA